jgi:hypothetical protein
MQLRVAIKIMYDLINVKKYDLTSYKLIVSVMKFLSVCVSFISHKFYAVFEKKRFFSNIYSILSSVLLAFIQT